MKITVKYLKKNDACIDSIEEFKKRKIKSIDQFECIDLLIKEKNFDWCSWLIVQLLNIEDRIRYAINAAELVIDIFENKYPDDKRPRVAIDAAKKYLEFKTAAHAAAAAHAAHATAVYATAAGRAAVYAAAAAYATAAGRAAADAAEAAAYAAEAAAYTAYAATRAAEAAAYAAYADAEEIKLKILNYGISLLKKRNELEKKDKIK